MPGANKLIFFLYFTIMLKPIDLSDHHQNYLTATKKQRLVRIQSGNLFGK